MISRAIQCVTGERNDPNAWHVLFKYYNVTHGYGNVGYQYNEKVTIKINMNQDNKSGWANDDGMPSPHAVYSLVKQLINVAGVPGSAITIYDASRYIGNPIYNKIRSNPGQDFQNVKFVVSPSYAGSGRVAATRDTSAKVYAGSSCPDSDMPQCVSQTKYLINMALLRAHSLYGVTLCGKNHFGSVYCSGWSPSLLHSYGDRNRGMGTYNCLVDLIGSKYLGGKTMLYLIDALYAARDQGAEVIRFQSFGDDWCSSIFASQDPVAIDSVGFDFLRSEWDDAPHVLGTNDYLIEAARADNPPSGTFYDPDHKANVTRLKSLGVYENWNNPKDMQYSRNLGTGKGIELIKLSQN